MGRGEGLSSCWEGARLCSSPGSRTLNHDLPTNLSLLPKAALHLLGSPPSQGTSPLPNQSSTPEATLHSPPGYSSPLKQSSIPQAVLYSQFCPTQSTPRALKEDFIGLITTDCGSFQIKLQLVTPSRQPACWDVLTR